MPAKQAPKPGMQEKYAQQPFNRQKTDSVARIIRIAKAWKKPKHKANNKDNMQGAENQPGPRKWLLPTDTMR